MQKRGTIGEQILSKKGKKPKQRNETKEKIPDKNLNILKEMQKILNVLLLRLKESVFCKNPK